jgi:hypothetical protein
MHAVAAPGGGLHKRFVVIGKCMSYKLSLLISECAVHETVFYSFKLVCKSQGPVVQRWISANPGLKFNPLF